MVWEARERLVTVPDSRTTRRKASLAEAWRVAELANAPQALPRRARWERLHSVTRVYPSPMLVLEAATAVGSVALVVDDVAVGCVAVAMGATRDDTMFPAVQSLLKAAGVEARALGAVVCGAGPGSFTSLRIAASLAKGLCFATECRLYAVSSLMLAAATCAEPGDFLAHSDALRGERFTLRVTIDGDGTVSSTGPVERTHFDGLATRAGDARRLAVGSSPSPEHEFRIVTPDAGALLRCTDWWQEGPVSLDAWEPDYGRLAEAQVKWEVTHGRSLRDA